MRTPKSHTPAIAIALTISATACQTHEGNSNSDTPEELAYLSYVQSDIDGSDADLVLDPCSLTGSEAAVVVARIASPRMEMDSDCPDLTWASHERTQAVVERSILSDVPTEFTLVTGFHDVSVGRPEVDDRFLFTLRERDGLYVVVRAIKVELEPTEELALANTQSETVDLPASISELTTEVQAAQQLDTCPNSRRSEIAEMSDEDYDAQMTRPELCEDSNAIPAGTCTSDADCAQTDFCNSDGLCRDRCDPNFVDAGCTLTDG